MVQTRSGRMTVGTRKKAIKPKTQRKRKQVIEPPATIKERAADTAKSTTETSPPSCLEPPGALIAKSGTSVEESATSHPTNKRVRENGNRDCGDQSIKETPGKNSLFGSSDSKDYTSITQSALTSGQEYTHSSTYSSTVLEASTDTQLLDKTERTYTMPKSELTSSSTAQAGSSAPSITPTNVSVTEIFSPGSIPGLSLLDSALSTETKVSNTNLPLLTQSPAPSRIPSPTPMPSILELYLGHGITQTFIKSTDGRTKIEVTIPDGIPCSEIYEALEEARQNAMEEVNNELLEKEGGEEIKSERDMTDAEREKAGEMGFGGDDQDMEWLDLDIQFEHEWQEVVNQAERNAGYTERKAFGIIEEMIQQFKAIEKTATTTAEEPITASSPSSLPSLTLNLQDEVKVSIQAAKIHAEKCIQRLRADTQAALYSSRERIMAAHPENKVLARDQLEKALENSWDVVRARLLDITKNKAFEMGIAGGAMVMKRVMDMLKREGESDEDVGQERLGILQELAMSIERKVVELQDGGDYAVVKTEDPDISMGEIAKTEDSNIFMGEEEEK
ncbi:MAG: hypothetical protein M1834_001314 [Cirrosporium novae-zelandiae]|nr:MAG: hypothetical protein M1834_001314 [Cirrosporium novae-zelandiae]